MGYPKLYKIQPNISRMIRLDEFQYVTEFNQVLCDALEVLSRDELEVIIYNGYEAKKRLIKILKDAKQARDKVDIINLS